MKSGEDIPHVSGLTSISNGKVVMEFTEVCDVQV